MASRSFFFSSRRRHTRLVGDWSSDVCSSDLQRHGLRRLSRQVPAPPAAACIPCRRWTPRPPCQDRSALRPVHARALGAVLPARLFARSQSRRVGLGANQDPWAQQAPATPQRVAPRQGRVGPRCHSFSPGTRSVFIAVHLPLEVFPGRQAPCRAVFGTWGSFPDDARASHCPFVLTSFTGWSSQRCPGTREEEAFKTSSK